MINIGCGNDVTIREVAELICEIVSFKGELDWDQSKPDGTPGKLLDVSKLQGLGWSLSISLRDGIQDTYQWFVKNWVGTQVA